MHKTGRINNQCEQKISDNQRPKIKEEFFALNTSLKFVEIVLPLQKLKYSEFARDAIN